MPNDNVLKIWWFKRVDPPTGAFQPFYVPAKVGTYAFLTEVSTVVLDCNAPAALAEFRRILNPGGFALITSPDVESIASMVLEYGLDHVAENGFVNLFGRDARAAGGFGDDFAAQFGRRKTGKAALELTNGRADCGEDYRSFHRAASNS